MPPLRREDGEAAQAFHASKTCRALEYLEPIEEARRAMQRQHLTIMSFAEVASVQNVAGRTFFRKGTIWFDHNYPSGQKVVKVQALSDAHFQLLHARPEVAKYAAVGDEVVAGKTDAKGSFRLTAKASGKCSVTVTHGGQTASVDVVLFDKPSQYRLVLETKDGKLTLRRV